MNNFKNSLNCFLPVLYSETQNIINKLFTDEEKLRKTYYSEKNNFSIESYDYFSILYYGPLNDLKDKIFYSSYALSSIIIKEYEIINLETIIKIKYEKFDAKLKISEQLFEMNNNIMNDESFIIILKNYLSKPKSLYYNKISLENFEKNKLSGNFEIRQANKDKDFIIIEINKVTRKKQYYFYQKI